MRYRTHGRVRPTRVIINQWQRDSRDAQPPDDNRVNVRHSSRVVAAPLPSKSKDSHYGTHNYIRWIFVLYRGGLN